MLNKIPNRQIIAECLERQAKLDKDLIVLCTDSRGSASLSQYASMHPDQFLEMGIAEQNAVSVAAGLAACGKRPFVVSPACFLSTRSQEQARIDVAYSNKNVKLIGVSGGVSYGMLGMSHHSAQDIATMGTIPNMRVYLPSDRFLTAKLMEVLVRDESPAYVRVSRSPSTDVYNGNCADFQMDRAVEVRPGKDACIVACGETVAVANAASLALEQRGVGCRVLDMYCVKPLDRESLLRAARETKCIVTLEEHTVLGGFGALAAQTLMEYGCNVGFKSIGLPDAFPYAGKPAQIFAQAGLTADNVLNAVWELLHR